MIELNTNQYGILPSTTIVVTGHKSWQNILSQNIHIKELL
jgi:hypothetical protein